MLKQGDSKYGFLEFKENKWDAKNTKHGNLVCGTDSCEAVCVSQNPKSSKNECHFNYKRLVNVKHAVNDNDCVTKFHTKTLDDLKFDGKNKQLKIIFPGSLSNYVTVDNQILKCDGGVLKKRGSKYDFLGSKVNNWIGAKRKTVNLVEAQIMMMFNVSLKYQKRIKTSGVLTIKS